MVYATDRFEEAAVERLLEQYQVVLQAMVDDPERRLADVPLLGEGERLRLQNWNATAADYPRDCCAHQLFAAEAARAPDAPALATQDAVLTYGDVERRSDRLA